LKKNSKKAQVSKKKVKKSGKIEKKDAKRCRSFRSSAAEAVRTQGATSEVE